ncbi:signal peptidase I [Microcella putealis]|uniref:Signal peptidase I n=1 Tax=Microcella putealis TaxID=337005 RepID=A0A4Q7LSU6_9MICO|nr:signal peptidase I [Microcella putealis]RZS57571.1 signal peptidase I [Microcella putealis]TQM24638.1 signal peptidase I [Microcella putealis]
MTDETAPPTSAADETPSAHGTDAERPSPRNHVLGFLRDVVVIVAAALVISFLIKTFLIRSFFIPSVSMEPTLEVDDRIIVNQLAPDLVAVERGDVVVFRDPGRWLTTPPEQPRTPIEAAGDWLLSLVGLSASDSDEHLVKRVIGIGGDRVVCCNDLGQLVINGVPIDEPYVKVRDGAPDVSGIDFQVTVPEGSLWVMGDNRYESSDSRYNRTGSTEGFVPLDDVVGRAIVVSWPLERWAWLDNYPLTFDGVDPAE